MLLEGIYYCNVCGKSTKNLPKLIFVEGICEGETIHVCTSCIPVMVHGDGRGVVSNAELKDVLRAKAG